MGLAGGRSAGSIRSSVFQDGKELTFILFRFFLPFLPFLCIFVFIIWFWLHQRPTILNCTMIMLE